jgi:TonB-linked SusC/RagA family outer membrane protein
MKTKLSGILTLLLAFVVQITFAQERTITGTVSDESGPLPGVSVLIEGTTSGTETDFDGNYAIEAESGDVLRYSFVGMTTVTKTVGADGSINVTMVSEANTLDEVVLTAFGLEVKKDDDLSSSTAVEPDVITRSGESGLIQGLAGKTSGLKITRSSGDPGAGAYIQIRGQNTITGSSSPLIVVDGVPVSNTNVGGGTDGVTQQSRLNDFNPEDIAKVTVLKGAAAAAVWGTGAANGAIIIQTKKGVKGKMSIDVTSAVSYDRINVEFEKQSEFGQGYPNWWIGVDEDNYGSDNGRYVPNTGFSWGDRIAARSGAPNGVVVGNTRFESNTGNVVYPFASNSDGTVAKNDTRVYNDINRNQVFGTGTTYNLGASISYANENSNTFLSVANWDQNGIIKGRSSYNRSNLRLNHTVQLTEKFGASMRASYSFIRSDRIQQGSNLQGLYLGYLRTSPDFDNRDYKGTYYDSNNVPTPNSHRGYRNYLGSGAPVYNNPGWTINEQDNPNVVNRFNFAPELTYQFSDAIKLTARYGLDYYTDHRETFFPVNSAAGNAIGIYQQDDIQEKTENWNIFLQGVHDISDNFSFDWIAGTAFDQNEYARISGYTEAFTNPDVGDLRIFGNAEAANEFPTSFKQLTKKHGVYGVANFNMWNQLIVSLSGRYERPSTLEKNVFYPSASVGWKFSENFESDFLSFGKLRASYGEIGIEPVPYASSTVFFPGGVTSSWGDFLGASAYGNPFTRDLTLGNPNLKEERVKEFEIGADFRFFRNRLNLGITYYDRVTEDAILFVDVAPTTGFSSTPTNAAEITNEGMEVDLNWNVMRKGDFSWDINAFWSYNKNVVTDLAGVQSVFLAGFTGTSSRVVEGEPMAALWGTGFLRDDAGNLDLRSDGFPQISPEESVLGDPNPDWIGGLGTVVSWKGISLSAQFETSQGNDHWTGTEGVLNYFGIGMETVNESVAPVDLPTYDGRVITAGTTFRGNIEDFGGGPVALDSEWYTSDGGGFGNQSESFVKDASWTRLRELSLGYSFPQKILGNTGLTHFDVMLTGRNLVLWTDIEGFDPDINLTGASKGRGLDYFTNPATQSFILTLKFGF